MGSERVMAVVVVGGGGGWWWGGGWWVVVVVGAAWGGCEVSAKHAPLVGEHFLLTPGRSDGFGTLKPPIRANFQLEKSPTATF